VSCHRDDESVHREEIRFRNVARKIFEINKRSAENVKRLNDNFDIFFEQNLEGKLVFNIENSQAGMVSQKILSKIWVDSDSNVFGNLCNQRWSFCND
jgi:hypothetical protein